MPTPSPLSLRALAFAQDAVDRGIRGGLPGWGRRRGPDVDQYHRLAGVELPADKSEAGPEWSTAGALAAHLAAEADGEKTSFPVTGDARRVLAEAPETSRLPGPQRGAVGVVIERDDGDKPGEARAVICEAVFEDGTVMTVQGDAHAPGSTAADHWGRAAWKPIVLEAVGTTISWFDFGPAAPAESETEPAAAPAAADAPPAETPAPAEPASESAPDAPAAPAERGE